MCCNVNMDKFKGWCSPGQLSPDGRETRKGDDTETRQRHAGVLHPPSDCFFMNETSCLIARVSSLIVYFGDKIGRHGQVRQPGGQDLMVEDIHQHTLDHTTPQCHVLYEQVLCAHTSKQCASESFV